MALEMKSDCQRCSAEVVLDGEAYICSYECTFCRNCAIEMYHRCPNCRGELVARPRRTPPPDAA